MKFTLDAKVLKAGLSAVKPAISKRSYVPVMLNVLVSRDGDRLQLTTSNGDMIISQWIDDVTIEATPDEVTKGNLVCIPHSEFLAASQAFSGKVTLTIDRYSIKLQSLNIGGMVAEEFPALPINPDIAPDFTLGAGVFLDAISRVKPSANKHNVRPVLEGILLKCKNNTFSATATDGFRAARFTCPAKSSKAAEFILPAEMVTVIVSLLKSSKAKGISLAVAGDFIAVTFGAVQMMCHPTEGRFPDIDQVINKSCRTTTTVKSADIYPVFKAESLMNPDSPRMFLRASRDGVELARSEALLGGEGSLGIFPAVTTGYPVTIYTNAKFIQDGLDAIANPDVTFEIESPKRSVNMRSANPEPGFTFEYVFMPVYH